MKPMELFRERACKELGADAEDFEASLQRIASKDLGSLRRIEEIARECGVFDSKGVAENMIEQAQLAEFLQYDSEVWSAAVPNSEVTDPVQLGSELMLHHKQLMEGSSELSRVPMYELSKPEAQKAAWLSIASSLGREASVSGLIKLLSSTLDMPVVRYRTDMKGAAIAKFDWLTSISAAMETQPRFSPIHVAASVLSRKISNYCKNTSEKLSVAVLAVHNISENSVGWCTFLVKEGIYDKALDASRDGQ